MSNTKKGLSMALAALMTAGSLFNGVPVANAAAKKAPVKKGGLTAQQTANYKAAVNAVVVLENGIKKYGLTKPENVAYSMTKSAMAKVAVAKVVAGSSKNGLLARIVKADAAIAANMNLAPATLVSVENPADMTVEEGKEFKAPETVKATMSNNTTKDLKVIWDKTVDTTKVGETTLTGRVETSEKTVTLKVTVGKLDLDVTAITPLSLKQVKIEFNKPVVEEDKKDDIEDKDNYELRDKDNSVVNKIVKEVKLDDSKKFAVITFDDVLNNKDRYEIENQETYSLTIDEEVTGKEKVEKIAFKDLELPKVEGIEVAGIDTIKVKFSEPIKPFNMAKESKNTDYVPQLDKDDFDVNDGKVSIRKVELVNNNREANIILSGDLKDKEKLTVKVKGGIQDYAGLGAISETKEIEVAKDTKAPEIVGFKNIESDGVTLIFDKDVKFRNTSKTYMENTDDIYHTNDKNIAERVDIDGKELKIKFDTKKGSELQDGSEYIYVKADKLESLWEVKNDKLSFKVSRAEDSERPEVARVEQDKDSNQKVKVRFSEKVKEKEATDRSNYTIEDEKGKTYSIKSIKLQENDKEALIETNKEFDEDLKYKITVEDVEDKSGNVIKKVTKDFGVKDTETVDKAKVEVKFYALGTKEQKIVINFDKKMKTSDKYSINDILKYTLTSDTADFNGKKSINMDDIYKKSIKTIRNDEAVEISIPYYEKEDKSFNLQDLMVNKKHNISVEIARVADANDNLTAGSIVPDTKNVKIGTPDKMAEIAFDDKPEAQGLDTIYFSFDSAVSLNDSDIKIVAAKDVKDVEQYAYNNHVTTTKPVGGDASKVVELKDTKFKPVEKSSSTEITATLSRDFHQTKYDDNDCVLNYDGTYDTKDVKGMDLYVVVVPSKAVSGGTYVTKTDNDNEETLKPDYKKVEDKIAPELIDNDDYANGYMYRGYGDNAVESDVKSDKAVEYYLSKDAKHAAFVLTFTENIDTKSVGTGAFDLTDDFEDYEVTKAYATGNRVIVEIAADDKDDPIEVDASQIVVKGQFTDMNANKTDEKGFNGITGNYKMLTDAQAKELGIDFAGSVTPEKIAVTGVTLDKATAELKATETVQLTATVAPANATDKTVAFTTSDAKVATVDAAGKVTAVAEGTATITATAGDKTATCAVKVAKAEPISNLPTIKAGTLDINTALLGMAVVTIELDTTTPDNYKVTLDGIELKQTGNKFYMSTKTDIAKYTADYVQKNIVVTVK